MGKIKLLHIATGLLSKLNKENEKSYVLRSHKSTVVGSAAFLSGILPLLHLGMDSGSISLAAWTFFIFYNAYHYKTVESKEVKMGPQETKTL